MKACLVLNPAAGPRDFRRQLEGVIEYLQQRGWEAKLLETKEKGDATRFARQAADEGCDVAVAVGGDGTINEVVNGLVGSKTALGVIPAGTANVYAADVGIPSWNPLRPNAVLEAAKIVESGQRHQVDVGQVRLGDGRKRYFLMWCGVGLDAAISQEIKPEDTRRLGVAAWAIAGLMVTFNFFGTRASVTTEGHQVSKRILWAVVSNGQLYGRLWRIAAEAKMDDGFLDLAVFEGYDAWATIRHLASLTWSQYTGAPKIHVYRDSSFVINTRNPLPVHVDAEPVGTTPVKIKVVPRSLNVILPTQIPAHLFVDGKACQTIRSKESE